MLYECTSDILFSPTFRGDGTFDQYKSGLSIGSQMIQEMLNPCVVGVAFGWNTIFPAAIVTEQVTTPSTHIKRRFGNVIIGFQIGMSIIQKQAFVVPFDRGAIIPSNSKVLFCQ